MPVGACELVFLNAAERDSVLLERYKVPAVNRRGHFGLPAEAAYAFESLDAIFTALGGRPDEQAAKTLTPLPGDFIHTQTSTVIEIDESQHFTSFRRLTFDSYMRNAAVNYDLDHYAELCGIWAPKADAYRRTKSAVCFGPSGRQRQRAYNDAYGIWYCLLSVTGPSSASLPNTERVHWPTLRIATGSGRRSTSNEATHCR